MTNQQFIVWGRECLDGCRRGMQACGVLDQESFQMILGWKNDLGQMGIDAFDEEFDEYISYQAHNSQIDDFLKRHGHHLTKEQLDYFNNSNETIDQNTKKLLNGYSQELASLAVLAYSYYRARVIFSPDAEQLLEIYNDALKLICQIIDHRRKQQSF